MLVWGDVGTASGAGWNASEAGTDAPGPEHPTAPSRPMTATSAPTTCSVGRFRSPGLPVVALCGCIPMPFNALVMSGA